MGDDNAYALACDKKGRVWAGTLNHGVSVFNGQAWKTYDPLTGPLGSRVFALATSPVDGDVWIATEAGLTRYSLAKDVWTYFTRADGLPSDQANALAFDRKGTLYVGTQCDGLAIASPNDNYKTWRQVTGPERMPTTPGGAGLPTNLINCLLVSKLGTVYVGTTTGLARSEDNGKSWRFLRGADWSDKVKGLYKGPAPKEIDTKGHLLLEDYVTSLAEDGAGRLYVGHRQQGLEVVDEKTGARLSPGAKEKPSDDFVTAVLPLDTQPALLARYGNGLTQATLGDNPKNAASIAAAPKDFPALPSPARPPTAAQLAAMLKRVKAFKSLLPPEGAAYLGEDWVTQGDWVARYGRQYARLCAMDHVITCSPSYSTESTIGLNHVPGDGLRWWVSWLQTDNPRSLYTPVLGHRKQAEWDDHGEEYKQEVEGPDIWTRVVLAEPGVHRISVYFLNKDGHQDIRQWGGNRYRDYLVELKPDASNLEAAEAAPTLAHARVRDFWGGVYEQFVVSSPGSYYIRIARNNSMNTIVSAILIDKLKGMKRFTDTEPMAYMHGVAYDPPTPAATTKSSAEAATAQALWSSLDNAYDRVQSLSSQERYRLLAYRAAMSGGGSEALLANWRWNLRLWTPGDREEFAATMAQAWQVGVNRDALEKAGKLRPIDIMSP